jgi:hypothetical protein
MMNELTDHYPSQKAFSVAKIEHPEVLDENGKQKVGGLMDPKMGSAFLWLTFAHSLTWLSHRPQLQVPDLHGGYGGMSRTFRSHRARPTCFSRRFHG